MSKAQKGGADSYLRDRINNLAAGNKSYGRGIDSSTQAFAEMVAREQVATKYRGYVILNGYINSDKPQTDIQIWNPNPKLPKRL